MEITGVNSVSPGTGHAPVQNSGINSATSVGDSNSNNTHINSSNHNSEIESGKEGGFLEPLKQMATSDFLTLHNAHTGNGDNVMDKLLKILEAVLALELLDKTLEAVNENTKGNNFKDIA